MLSIRMKRMGRKGHPTYRVVVQDSRWAPSSGRFVAQLGSYDPHTKTATLVKEKAELYLKNGAQPSERVVKLLTSEGVKMPSWVASSSKQKRGIRNPDKLRRNRPAEEKPEASEAQSSTESAEVESGAEKPVAVEAETPSEETTEVAEAPEAEAPAEEKAAEAPAPEEASEEPAEKA